MDQPRQVRATGVLAAALAAACLVLLAYLVVARQGGLGWDDADYLRRGLTHARETLSGPPSGELGRLLGGLLMETPKPPLLVGWITLGALILGKSQLAALMVLASVVPFAVLLLACHRLAWRLYGASAAGLTLLLVLASPRCLSFGAKVMVETFLGLWVLLAIGSLSLLMERPSRRAGAIFGAVVGLALLTKLTAVLLLAGAVIPLFGWSVRRHVERPARLRSLAWSGLACLLIAGPWYAGNLVPALRFAAFSSRFNVVAEGRGTTPGTVARIGQMADDLPGWPLLALGGLIGVASMFTGSVTPESGAHGSGSDAVTRRYHVLVTASSVTAIGALMIPSYFDTRFLLPIWPAVAVALGGVVAQRLERFPPWPRLGLLGGLVGCIVLAGLGLLLEPVFETSWSASELIDRLVREHGVMRLANVGNLVSWNVCKTGLANELRKDPADCFVLGDLSMEPAEGLRARLPRFDAVVVLDPRAYPPSMRAVSPGLNRATSFVDEVIHDDPELIRLETPYPEGLPPMTVYLRKATDDIARWNSNAERFVPEPTRR